MKKLLTYAASAMVAAAMITACTDEVKFGDDFIEKAPGGTVTLDTVFNNPKYTQQFLNALYARQYYGLPYSSNKGTPNSHSPYTGKFDALTDCYQLHWGSTTVFNSYYSNNLTASNTPLMSYDNDGVWETVRRCWLLIENIDRTPGLTEEEKANMVAQAKCIMASRYFDLFPHFGGLPLITHTYTGTESSFELSRATVEETVNFIVNLLDEAIPHLLWKYDGNTTETNETQTGRWTQAGAMALKAKVLTIAASPIFNADAPYYDGSTEAEQQHLVWYGNYDASRWDRALKACQEFFNANTANGNKYGLYMATAKTAEAYRNAYRMGYILDSSPEALHYTRVISIYGSQGTYCWLSWGWHQNGINRNNYTPTQEYMEMFPWKDGTPFNWENDMASGKIEGNSGKLFFTFEAIRGGFKKTASRDPRLYENMFVNGQQEQLVFGENAAAGNVFEFWVGGYHAGFNVKNANGEIVEALATMCPTGYGNVKYLLDEQFHRKGDNHWNVVTYPEMILLYAECLCQTGNNTEAIRQVDLLRSRVGMQGLAVKNPSLNLTTDKNNLLEEILRERACELGLTNNRYYDMVRYKRTDWMTKRLHGLAIYRMQQGSTGQWGRVMKPWLGDDKDSGTKEPSRFEYEVFELQNRERVMWSLDPNSLDVKKWLLAPFPQTEINKGYGLVQNPGW